VAILPATAALPAVAIDPATPALATVAADPATAVLAAAALESTRLSSVSTDLTTSFIFHQGQPGFLPLSTM
jgi:hypothetical protein